MNTFTGSPGASEPGPSLDNIHQVLTQLAQGVEDLAGHLRALDRKLAQTLDDRTDTPEEYLSIKRAAALAGLSPTKIRREIKAGRLLASNAGTPLRPLYRIQRTDLEHWLENKKGGNDVPPEVRVHKRKFKSRYFGEI
jgi:excisionase family DNA binding protein